jgi:hypothetical protein
MNNQGLIKIKVTYLSKDLQRITRKKGEVFRVPGDFRSGDFIDFFQERYPEIFEKFGPGYLGFTLNGEKPHVLQRLRDQDHYEFSTWTKEEIFVDEISKHFRESIAIIKLPKEEFEMPKWMECTWRRNPCGRDDCPICGRIKRDRQRHIERGEDPDDMKSVLEDVSQNFKEALLMIKKDAERMGIDITNIDDIQEPPKPEEFPLYQTTKKWRDDIFNIVETAQNNEEFWVFTETVQDLTWYANLLTAKVYRQLCNRWHLEKGDDYGEFDYKYTQGIIKESIKILKKSLAELYSYYSGQKVNLMLAYNQLQNLEKEILKI